jgi:hypothetical protein
MSRRFPSEELLDLASQLLDGSLTDAQYDQLRELVAKDHASAAWLVDWMEQHVMLTADLGTLDRTVLAPRPLLETNSPLDTASRDPTCNLARRERAAPATRRDTRRQTSLVRSWLLTLAVCLLVMLVYRWGWMAGAANEQSRTPVASRYPIPAQMATFQPEVATIVGGVDAQFDNGVSPGDRLGPGRLKLKRGMAQIAFDRGATVVLEGPAEMELFADGKCLLVSGSLSADVPPEASGFSIAAGGIKVAESDAQFGVKTSPEAFTEVHAFGGELHLFDYSHPGDPQRRLAQGEALRWHAQGVEGISTNPTAFVTNDRFREAQLLEEKRSYNRWRKHSQRWNDEPNLLLQYEFSEIVENAIPNAPHASAIFAVSHQSPRLVRGRWSLKPAMLFDGRTDMLKVEDRPELRLENDMTLAVWLRTRSYPVQGWTRVVGKGQGCDRNYGLWMDHNGSMLWQVMSDADPQQQSDWDRYSLRTGVIPIGHWVLVAGVKEQGQLKVYVNGILQVSAPAPERVALSDAPLTIGFYGNASGHNQFYCGDIDELILLDRAMSHQELLQMYEAGDPTNNSYKEEEEANSPVGLGV